MARPQRVENFNQFVLATGGSPLLRLGNPQLLAGHFDLSVSITDNVAVAADLTLQSVWDKRVQTLYGSSASADVEGVFRLAAIQLYINDADFRGEAIALKESLDNLAYIHLVRTANTMDIPLRGHITEPWTTPAGLTTAMLALAEERSVLKGPPRILERPLNIDIRTDQMTLQVDTAINWASGNIAAFVRLFGHLAPRDYPGALVADTDTCSDNIKSQSASADPWTFMNLKQAGFGAGILVNPGGFRPQPVNL